MERKQARCSLHHVDESRDAAFCVFCCKGRQDITFCCEGHGIITQAVDPINCCISDCLLSDSDQVPLMLCTSHACTVDEKGNSLICSHLDTNLKRFCTLDLIIPVLLPEDLPDLPESLLIFRRSFNGGEEWRDQAEAERWDKQVHVCFQPEAWMDDNVDSRKQNKDPKAVFEAHPEFRKLIV